MLDETQVLAHARDPGQRLYLERASWSDTAALSLTTRAVVKFKEKSGMSRTLKKKEKREVGWKDLPVLLGRLPGSVSGPLRHWTRGLLEICSLSLSEIKISAVWEEKTKTAQLAWRVKNIMSHY